MDIAHYSDYRDYLRDELERRLAKNPTYSLRAFARHLGISPQMLSFVVNRKKNISSGVASQFADRLNLDPAGASRFIDLVELSKTRKPTAKKILEDRLSEGARESLPEFRALEASKFKVISDWHHYAILELTQTEGFKSDIAWIAKRLGLKVFEVEQAVERLKVLELLEENSLGRLVRTEVNLTATYEAPNAALRKLAKQYLEKSIAALEDQTMEERDVTNITMSVDPKRIPQAKKMIADFRRKLCAFLEQGERTEVYVLSPALIKLTNEVTEN